ncbi:hypothetical protein TNCV_293991 [Trichonephila clavipes]|nr:hypothetical protein TNCV_293991 [Trichonephila clavipes]
MERIDSNLRACLSITAASQWLNLRLQFIGVIIVTAVAVVALLQREYSTVDPGNSKRSERIMKGLVRVQDSEEAGSDDLLHPSSEGESTGA